jgi:hypothetical protein
MELPPSREPFPDATSNKTCRGSVTHFHGPGWSLPMSPRFSFLLFAFKRVYLLFLDSAYAQIATLLLPTRSLPNRRRDLLPEAVRILGLKADRFKRPGGGADQFRVRGGAGAVR